MGRVIGAQHEFHDAQYVRDWATRFDPTPERVKLFDRIISNLKCHPLPARHVVELRIGPGYLASRLLEAIPDVTYEGVDFSQPMPDLAASRLRKFSDGIRFTRANLVADHWEQFVGPPVGAAVSTWASTIWAAKRSREGFIACANRYFRPEESF